MDMALDLNIIEGKSGRYQWLEQKFHGKNKLREFFENDEEARLKLSESVEGKK